MFSRTSIIVCIVAALAVSGCGRRGPLEPPPGAPPEQKAPPAAPTVQPPGAPGGLFRNTQSTPEAPETKTENATRKPSSFVLDPLL